MHFSSAVWRTVSILTAFMLLATSAVAKDEQGIGITQVIGTTASATTGAFQDFSGQSFRLRVDAKDLKGVSATNAKFVADKSTKFLERTRSRARSVGNSGALKFAGAALLTGDVMVDVLARADGGDLQGAIAGGGALAGGMGFVSGVSYLSGLAGAAVATAVPVIGPVLGPSIGGAVGSVAGGFLAATAYDLLMKDNVGEALEETIAPLFDQRTQRVIDFLNRLRLQAAMDLKPHLERDYATAGGSNPREVNLLPLPTLVVLPPTPSASSVIQPEVPPAVIALTSFDAVLVSVSIEMADGSSQNLTAEEINTIGAPFDCYVLSFRDGAFSLTCDHGYELPQNGGIVRSEWQYKALGVSDGTRYSGTSLSWTRNYSVGLQNMSDGEANRHAYVSVVTGDVDPHGKVTMIEEPVQQENASAKWKTGQNGYQVNTGEFYSYAAELTPVARTITTYQIDPGSYDGVLLLPNLTADDIRATEFELPDVFFQHGVSPPERVR